MFYRFEVVCYLEQRRLEVDRAAASRAQLALAERSGRAPRRVPFQLHTAQQLVAGVTRVARTMQHGVGRWSLSRRFSRS